MSTTISKQGVDTSNSYLTFTDNTNSVRVYRNNVIETSKYYYVSGFRFDKNKTILIWPFAARCLSTSTAGTVTINLLTSALSNQSGISIVRGTSASTWLSALQKVLSLKSHTYSYKLMYSSVSYDSTLGINERDAFVNHNALTASNYSLANKAPVVETPGSGSMTLSFNASAKTVTVTANKKVNWSMVGMYVSLV